MAAYNYATIGFDSTSSALSGLTLSSSLNSFNWEAVAINIRNADTIQQTGGLMSKEKVWENLLEEAKGIYDMGIKQTIVFQKQIDEMDIIINSVPEERKDMANFIIRRVPSDVWEASLAAFDMPAPIIKEIIELAYRLLNHDCYKVTGQTFITILTNPNSHSYKLGKTYLTTGSIKAHTTTAISPNGDRGNNFPLTKGSIRPATEKEIATWVAEWIAFQVKQYPADYAIDKVQLTNFLETLTQKEK